MFDVLLLSLVIGMGTTVLSDLSRMISGEIVHVDGGYHAMAAPLRTADDVRRGHPATR